jgi:lysophospholipase L1-like esterase
MRSSALVLAVLVVAAPCLAQDFAARWKKRVAAFKAENQALDPDRKHVVLLGSSSMEGWRYGNRIKRFLPAIADRALNRGISGDGIGLSRTTGILNRLGPSALDCTPSHIVLLNGRNSIGSGVERTATTYRKVVEKLKAGAPKAVIVLVTCAPVRGRYAHMAEKTAALNVKIREIAADLGCELIDLHAQLVGADGLMRPEVSSDGLHFKDEGYRRLGEGIERIVASGVTRDDSDTESGSAAPAGGLGRGAAGALRGFGN